MATDTTKTTDRPEARARTVQALFSSIVPRYDLMNTIMSGGFDRRWRRAAAEAANPQGALVLDLGTGTGELAAEMARHGAATVVGLDFVRPMLEVAASRQLKRLRDEGHTSRFEWLAGDALHLPFADATFDVVATAFVLRNLASLEAGLSEVCRVVRPGGQLVSLDMVIAPSPLFRFFFRPYFYALMPFVGGIVSGQPSAYRYLPQSIDSFLSAADLARRMKDAGFGRVQYRHLGFGSVAMHQAFAPES
jgi:demethylmenaquinone methyltransferase/2-methoxy-6-polyprenyl-1,4-benzoquinol methylase